MYNTGTIVGIIIALYGYGWLLDLLCCCERYMIANHHALYI